MIGCGDVQPSQIAVRDGCLSGWPSDSSKPEWRQGRDPLVKSWAGKLPLPREVNELNDFRGLARGLGKTNLIDLHCVSASLPKPFGRLFWSGPPRRIDCVFHLAFSTTRTFSGALPPTMLPPDFCAAGQDAIRGLTSVAANYSFKRLPSAWKGFVGRIVSRRIRTRGSSSAIEPEWLFFAFPNRERPRSTLGPAHPWWRR